MSARPVHLFVIGTGRSGTRTIADLFSAFPGCVLEHERKPALLTEVNDYLSGYVPREHVVELLRTTRRPDLIGGERLSGEANQRLSFILPLLAEVFPECRIIWLIRDGRPAVASMMHRGAFHPRERDLRGPHTQEWATVKEYAAYLAGEMTKEEWETLDQFGRCCWYWSFTNRVIKRDIDGVGLPWMTLRLEDLADAWPSVEAFLDLELPLPARLPHSNRSAGRPLDWRLWSRRQRSVFDQSCGPLMDEYYAGWRDELPEGTAAELSALVSRSAHTTRAAIGQQTRPLRRKLGLVKARRHPPPRETPGPEQEPRAGTPAVTRLPDFIGIGAQRCGSTTLATLLAEQSKISVSEPKELHFFDNRDGHYEDGLQWYSSHFQHAPAEAVCGEFTPEYLFVNGAAERISEAVPSAKLIAILRDPVARAWSHYWFNVRRGWEPKSFERALDAESERARIGEWERVVYGYTARGRYVEQLEHYERFFLREQLCVVFLEELRESPARTIETILRHIGLDDPPVHVGNGRVLRENVGFRPRSRRVHVATTRARRWGSRRGKPVQAVVRFATALPRRLNGTRGLPAMPPDTRARLLESFAASDTALAEWLGRPLPWSGER